MTEEYCKYEGEIAVLKESVPRIEKKIDNLTELLTGNSKEGLVTRVALLRQSINKAWWWLGAISLGLIGTAFVVIRKALLE